MRPYQDITPEEDKIIRMNATDNPLVKTVVEPGIVQGKNSVGIEADLKECAFNDWSFLPRRSQVRLVLRPQTIQRIMKRVKEQRAALEGDPQAQAAAIQSGDAIQATAANQLARETMDAGKTFMQLHKTTLEYVKEIHLKPHRSTKDYIAHNAMVDTLRKILETYGKMSGFLDRDGVLSVTQMQTVDAALVTVLAAIREHLFPNISEAEWQKCLQGLRAKLQEDKQTKGMFLKNARIEYETEEEEGPEQLGGGEGEETASGD